MNDSLVTQDKHNERIILRRSHDNERYRTYCSYCRGKISEGRNRRARFCSDTCRQHYHTDAREEFKVEVRHAKRLLVTSTCSICGNTVEQQVRPGPRRKFHETCKRRIEQQLYRARKLNNAL